VKIGNSKINKSLAKIAKALPLAGLIRAVNQRRNEEGYNQ
jgi:hypothetical protein